MGPVATHLQLPPHSLRERVLNRTLLTLCLICGIFALVAPVGAAEPEAAGVEFFEKKIRPMLIKHCYECHSSQAKDSQGWAVVGQSGQSGMAGGDSGPAVVPGDVEGSLLIESLHYGDDSVQMPPKGKLPDQVIADFEKWVTLGAPDPRSGEAVRPKSEIDWEAAKKFWSFQPPQQAPVPQIANADWPRDPIDHFILARLTERGLEPVGDAPRVALIRRAYYDLIGLPPNPQQVDTFVNDKSSQAFTTVVDRLLASPQFGERWGRHWLDLARYAESTGRSVNYPLNHAWRYRNYVIDALNADKPYDQFIREQIAGDLLPAENDQQANEQKIATGFLAVSPRALDYDDRKDVETEKYFLQDVDEQIDVTCRGILALTVSCARCHDHKFDPIPTADYYALAGIFRSSDALVGMVHGLGNSPRYKPNLLGRLAGADPKVDAAFDKYLEQVNAVWDPLKEEMTELWVIRRQEGQVGFTDKMRLDQEKVVNDMRKKLVALLKKLPPNMPAVMCMRDSDELRDVHVCIAGDPGNPGPLAPRGFLQALNVKDELEIPEGQSGRLQLAQWLTSRNNPLTARVMVNRVWLHLFGRGLVSTVDNFGWGGAKPSHPELLDHLAIRFMDKGWSLKKLIREIMLSRVYQLSSEHHADNYVVDPDNVLLWRMSRRRLEVEPIRDSILTVSGKLNLKRPVGSPLMKYGAGQFKSTYSAARSDGGVHRTVYQMLVRDMEPEMFQVFDFPSTSNVHGQRDTTTVASQALFLMNSPMIQEHATTAAQKLLATKGIGPKQRVERAYRQVLCRKPSEEETERVLAYLAEYVQADKVETEKRQAEQAAAKKAAAEKAAAEKAAAKEAAAKKAKAEAEKDNPEAKKDKVEQPKPDKAETEKAADPKAAAVATKADPAKVEKERQNVEKQQERQRQIRAWASLYQSLFASAEFRYLE